MIDPKILKEGQQIVLRQNKVNGKWQEFIVDEYGRILAVEDVKLFEKSKLEQQTPNNYEELKKNYKYLSKNEELSPPISINEPPSIGNNNELDRPEEDIDLEPGDHECERECPTAPCSICGSDAPICEPDIDEDPEISGKEPDPETDRDIDREIKEQEKERDCEVKESEEKK